MKSHPKATKRKQMTIPEDLHTLLKAQAKANGRTLIGQLRHLLTQA